MSRAEWRGEPDPPPVPPTDSIESISSAKAADEVHDRAVRERARQAAGSSDFLSAGRHLNDISNDDIRESTALDLSMLAVDAQDFDTAEKFAKLLSPHLKQQALLYTVRRLADSGDLDSAVEAASELREPALRNQAKRILSLAKVPADLEGAKRRARTIEDPRLRARTLIDIDHRSRHPPQS
jgi:hypothetical protein